MSRADRVAARLAERELDLLLVTNLVNMRYLTGFTGSSAERPPRSWPPPSTARS